MRKKVIVFGAALDASDFSLSIQMKHAYLARLQNNLNIEEEILDPYEGMLKYSHVISNDKYIKKGKFLIDSWLTPKPILKDISRINQNELLNANYKGIIKIYSEKLSEYIEKNIIPGIPLMVGVDHSLTGGVLRALSKEYGSQNIIVIIFDAHFDGIPLDISMNITNYFKEHPEDLNQLISEQISNTTYNEKIQEVYTCASFLYYLLNEKVILPENLIIIGCQDYPDQKTRSVDDQRVREFVNFFDLMEKKGITFIPRMDISQMIEKLSIKLETIENPYFYVSFDVDVGVFKEIIAARFRNTIGMDKSEILQIAKIIKEFITVKNCELIGLDIMEIDTFLLGKSFPKSGRKDLTIEVVDELIDYFLG